MGICARDRAKIGGVRIVTDVCANVHFGNDVWWTLLNQQKLCRQQLDVSQK